MKYYWINCNNSLDRREYMESQFNKFNLDNERIEAYTPDTLPQVIKPANCKQSDVEIACTCSHLKAIKRGLDENLDTFVILEDDVRLVFDINYNAMMKMFKNKSDVDIVQLFTSTPNQKELHQKYNNGSLFLKWHRKMYGTCAYLVTRKGARKLLDKFVSVKEKYIRYDFSGFKDRVTADTLLYKPVKTAVSTYPLFYNNNEEYKSIIHDDHNNFHVCITKIAKQTINNIKPPAFCQKL